MRCIYIHIHMHLYIIYVLLSKLTIMFPSAFKIHLGVFYPSSLPLPDKVPTLLSPFFTLQSPCSARPSLQSSSAWTLFTFQASAVIPGYIHLKIQS